MPSPKSSKPADILGVRSKELHAKVKAIVAANPGKITMSDLVRAAVEEKLDRIAAGVDEGIRLKMPPKG